MADTTASDKRSVIKNATQGGLIKNPLQNTYSPINTGLGIVGKGNTIATKDEINQAKATQGLTPKPMSVNPDIEKIANQSKKTTTSTKSTVAPQISATNTNAPMSVDPNLQRKKLQDSYNAMNTGNPFQNSIVQPINGIEVVKQDGNSIKPETKTSNGFYDYNRNKLITKTDAERKKDVSAGIEALYTDAYNKVTDGQQLTLQDVLNNSNYKKQFDGVDEAKIQELINDANTLAQYDDFDMQNVLSIYDKHQDLGLLLDYTKLSPNSKAAYLNAVMSQGENSVDKGLWKYVEAANWASPLYWGIKGTEWMANMIGDLAGYDVDLNIKEQNQKLRDWLADNKHDMLSQKEIDEASKDEIEKLDKQFKQYYTTDKNGEKKWNSISKKNEYERERIYLTQRVKDEHDDGALNFLRNAVLNLFEIGSLAVDMVAEPGTLIGGLGSTAVGGAEKGVGYAWDVYDLLRNGKWEHKDITQHLAELGGYKDYEEALQNAEYKLKDSQMKDFGMAILKQIQTDTATAGLMADYISEAYGSTDKFVQSFGERPVETISDIVTLFEGGAFLAGKLGLINPLRAEAIVNSLGKLDPFEQAMKYGNKLNYGPILKAETGALKIGGKVLKLPVKGVKNMGEMIVNKLSGLSEEERKFIRENPEDVDKFIKGEENSQSLIDKIKSKFDDLTSEKRLEGEEYEKIRNSNTPIATKDLITGIKDTLGTIGGKLTDKGITLSKRFTPAIENKVNELYTYINDLQKKGNKATAEDLHWFRQQLDSVANWDKIPKGLEATFTNMVKDMRRLVDASLKDQVPGMRELDAKYSSLLGVIKGLKQDWFNKDGTLKDSAYSKIRNLTNKGTNQPKLERLESQIPGITQDLKALAISETVEKASKQMVGQYAQQIRGVGGGITAITSLLTGGFSIPAMVMGLLGMQYATPKNLVSLLKFGGKIDKKINGILDKIINSTKLTALETAELARYLNENKGELRDKVEYMHEKGILNDAEYKEAVKHFDLKQREYDRAQSKTRTAAGDKEKTMAKEDEEAVLDWVKNNAKNPGWVVRVLDETGMMDALSEAGEKAEKGTQGFFYDKYINLLENPTDTTAQHEFFHAVFSVVDSKTKDYLLQEARKILKEQNMDKVAAEEWLAESFGIYAKRKMIDTGVIKTPRNFEQKLRNFFQKVYEWIQNFNGDRKTINKVFDEIYGGKKKIGKKGQLDLSFLLEDKKVDKKLGVSNGLRKKAVYHGSPADFDKFDSTHMGEGEGAQAHGWGHYVAVEEGTARHYADLGKIKGNNWEYDGKTVDWVTNKPNWEDGEAIARNSVLSHLNTKQIRDKNYTPQQAIDDLRKDWSDTVKKDREKVKEMVKDGLNPIEYNNRIYQYENWLKGLDILDVSKFKENGKSRNLYNLDIPDPVKADTPTGKNYLEEDGAISKKELEKINNELLKKEGYLDISNNKNLKSVSDMTKEDVENIVNIAKKSDDWTYNKVLQEKELSERRFETSFFTLGEIFSNQLRGRLKPSYYVELLTEAGFKPDLEFVYGKNGKEVYRSLENVLGSDKKASKFLESLGYDGIHYFGGRDGEAYVIFNDDALQIKDHIRYKKKIDGKDVEITPNVKSPDQLIEKNSDGLSVMKSFISDKQAEKALNVNKALLDKDGNPYLWTHTNKYDAPQFANFENAKDSKYKEFGDYEIAWFSNSEDMSRSYANQESKLADTKPINSIEEFNDRFSKYDIDGTPYNTEWKKGDNKEWKYGHKTSIDKERNEYVLNQYDSESHKYKDLETLYNEWHNGGYDGQSEKEVIDGIKKLVHEEFIDSPDFRLYDDVDIKKEKDGYVLTTSSKKELGRYKSEQEALAKSTAKKHVSGKYHYQGIITDIKNPLVVDLGKYKPGEIKRFRDGDKIVGEHGRYWSDLGNAYEFVKREQPNVDEIFSKVEKEWGGAKKASNDIKYYAFDIEREGDNLYKAYKDMEEGPAKKFAEERLLNYRKASDVVGYISRGVVDELKPEWRNLRVESDGKTTTIGNLYDKAISEYNKYKDVFDVFGEGNRIWKESGKYMQPEGVDSSKTKNFINLLKKNGMSEGAISILHGTDLMNRIDLVYSPFASEGWAITKLRDKSLQTNDYVFYALRKGGYDGVLFKDIVDYGGKGDNKGGDVLASFKSSDFKAWDNANPTDSKYISYKKKVSLDKKSEGLQKKNSSGLLAKGRDRMGDNGMRYKTNISEKDSSGKKLSEGQKKFFAGSKVVDKDGNLLRVYHGTRENFTVFDNQKGKFSSNGMAKLGNWFTPSKEGAKQWAKENSLGMKPKAMEGYLDIKNPKIYEKWDATEHLKNVENDRQKLIKDSWKLLDSTGYNQLNKERYKKYFDKDYKYEGFGSKEQEQNKLIEQELKTLAYLSNDYIIEYKSQSYGTDGYQMVKNMREKGLSNEQIIKKANEAKEMLDRLENIRQEHRKGSFTDAYELFENDLRSYGGQTIKDRVGGSWMAMDDEAGAVKKYVEALKKQGYDGIIIKDTEYDGEVFGKTNDQYVAFDSNQFKNIDNKNPTKNEDIRFKKVYHGSPADFDAFDSSHMGEGEGNQAHGWGHYVAVNKGTAEKYAYMLGREKHNALAYKGEVRNPEKYQSSMVTRFDDEYQLNYGGSDIEGFKEDFPMIKERILKGVERSRFSAVEDYNWELNDIAKRKKLGEKITPAQKEKLERLKKYVQGLDRTIKEIKDTKPEDITFKEQGGRHLYDLDIPDPLKKNTPTGKNYLEEGDFADFKVRDKFIKSAEEYGLKKPVDTKQEFIDSKGGLKGAFEYEMNHRTVYNYGDMYDVLADYLGGQKEASKFLESLGYDGIHYFGEQDGEAYVIFNDKGLDIKDHIRYKKQTQTPEFKEWFEGSKVVDKEGKPLVAYHGTHGDFTIFDKEKIGSNTNNEGLFGKGFYFTTDSKYGDYYKGKGWSKDRLEGKTMQVYLDIKNPFMWNDYKGPQAIEKLRKELKLPKSVLEWNNYGDNGIHVFTKPEQSRRFTEALEKAGYDGVWFKYDNGTQDEIVAFNPNQIKSATDNIGTFDKNNPDIRYKKGLQKKESGLEKKDNGIRYRFNNKGFTTTRKLDSADVDDIKYNRQYGLLKTYDRNTNEDTLKNISAEIKNNLGKDVRDGFKLRRDDIKHAYNSHGYDTELGYGKSLTKKDFENIPDILENYDSATFHRVLDSNGHLVDRYKLYKDYGNNRQYLVIDIGTQKDGKYQLSFKTTYVNDAAGRAKYNADKAAGLIKSKKKAAKQQYGDRFHL